MIRSLQLLTALAVGTASCGSGGSSACVETREPVDPASFLHVVDIGGAEFASDPPTSGPHVSGVIPHGVLDSPMAPAIQVSILESGSAIVQYNNELTAAEIDSLEELAGQGVVVAPGSNLPSEVVATAWTWKLSCSSPDLGEISRFTDRRVSDAPGAD